MEMLQQELAAWEGWEGWEVLVQPVEQVLQASFQVR